MFFPQKSMPSQALSKSLSGRAHVGIDSCGEEIIRFCLLDTRINP